MVNLNQNRDKDIIMGLNRARAKFEFRRARIPDSVIADKQINNHNIKCVDFILDYYRKHSNLLGNQVELAEVLMSRANQRSKYD